MKGTYLTIKSRIKGHVAEIVSAIVLIVVLIGIPQHTAHAQDSLTSFLGFPKLGDLVVQMVAEFVNINLQLASWVLAIAGFLLNFSMSVTLNIKQFVEGTPAIYTVWKATRDISGMMIIFMLLYAAIRMILGQDAKMGAMVKTIVIAGVLINFSFFIAGLGIDVSNIVSLQLYNAIAPANKLTGLTSLNPSQVKEHMRDGGISDIFMQSLKIVSIYDVRTLQLKNNDDVLSPSVKIILMGVVGVVIIYTAAASFFLAAVAFIVRFITLLFLLAFSPIWIAGYAIPQLKEYSTKWTSIYITQLKFMPVYLLLMYFAMSVLASNTLFGNAYVGKLTSSDAWYANFLTIAVNAAMVIFMLNLPLLAAISMGGISKKFGDKFDATNIWKKVGGFAGRNTFGATAGRINDSAFARKFYGNNPNLGLAVSKGLSKVSGAGFGSTKGGYDAALKARGKSLEELEKRVGTVKRENYSSDTKFKAAQDEAKEMEKSFRSSLTSASPLTLFMKDRANMSHKYKVEKKDRDTKDSKALNKDKRKAEGEISDNNVQIAFIDKEIARGTTESGVPLSPQARMGLENRKKSLQKSNDLVREAMEVIEEKLSKIKLGTSIDDLASKIGGLEEKISEKP